MPSAPRSTRREAPGPRVEPLSFYSAGLRLSALLCWPTGARPAAGYPGIVLCAGYTGTKNLARYDRFARSFGERGYATLLFDHRGWGESEGRRHTVYPLEQVEDIRHALTYLASRPEMDPTRLSLFGLSFGGSNALYAASVDDRIRAAVAVNPIGDGRDWLRRLRTEYEWDQWLDRLEVARVERVRTGHDELVDPIHEIMVETPTRRAAPTRDAAADLARTPLSCADAILDYRPEEVVHRATPAALMCLTTIRDTTTPQEHSERLIGAAREPKRLVLLPRSLEYPSYFTWFDRIVEETLAWLEQHAQEAHPQP